MIDINLRSKLVGNENLVCLNTVEGQSGGFIGQTVYQIDRIRKNLFGYGNNHCLNLEPGEGVLGCLLERIQKLENKVNRRKR